MIGRLLLLIEIMAMTFRLEQLHRAFAAENEMAFAAWAYATRDPIGAVSAKGYFHGCHRQLTVGDLIFCAVWHWRYCWPAVLRPRPTPSGKRRRSPPCPCPPAVLPPVRP